MVIIRQRGMAWHDGWMVGLATMVTLHYNLVYIIILLYQYQLNKMVNLSKKVDKFTIFDLKR